MNVQNGPHQRVEVEDHQHHTLEIQVQQREHVLGAVLGQQLEAHVQQRVGLGVVGGLPADILCDSNSDQSHSTTLTHSVTQSLSHALQVVPGEAVEGHGAAQQGHEVVAHQPHGEGRSESARHTHHALLGGVRE